mgnify:CR=1 FL=1
MVEAIINGCAQVASAVIETAGSASSEKKKSDDTSFTERFLGRTGNTKDYSRHKNIALIIAGIVMVIVLFMIIREG